MWRGGDGLEVKRVPATVWWARRQAAVRRRQHAGTNRASGNRSYHRLLCADHLHSRILLLCSTTMRKTHLLCTLHTLLMFLPRHADPLVQRRGNWSQVSEPHLRKHCDHSFVLHICHCLFCSRLLAVVFRMQGVGICFTHHFGSSWRARCFPSHLWVTVYGMFNTLEVNGLTCRLLQGWAIGTWTVPVIPLVQFFAAALAIAVSLLWVKKLPVKRSGGCHVHLETACVKVHPSR